MTRRILRLLAPVPAILAVFALGGTPVAATCGLDSGVRLVNGTLHSVNVAVTDSCSHFASVNVPAGQYLTLSASSGSAHILWHGGSSGENTPDLSRGQIYVQNL